jgi:hypothetical protein
MHSVSHEPDSFTAVTALVRATAFIKIRLGNVWVATRVPTGSRTEPDHSHTVLGKSDVFRQTDPEEISRANVILTALSTFPK